MAKNETNRPRVVWQLSNDGLQPSQTPHGFIARNPVSRVIQPESKAAINLQVAANVPMIAFPTRRHADDVTVQLIVQPGEDVTVIVENKSKHAPLMIEDKEGLVCLYPMVFDGVAEVG